VSEAHLNQTRRDKQHNKTKQDGYLDNRRNEFEAEFWDFQQRRPELVNEIQDKAFDVRTIVILIRHNHQMPIAQLFDIVVQFASE
jgi:hypothetical protein